MLGRRFSGQGALFSHALAGQFDAVGVVNQPVQDGIGNRWIPYNFIPSIYRHLAGHDGRAVLVTILDDFEQIAPLIVIELFGSPVIENEQIGPGQFSQFPGVSPIAFARASVAKSRGAR